LSAALKKLLAARECREHATQCLANNSMRTEYACACLTLVCRVALTSADNDGVVDTQRRHTAERIAALLIPKGDLDVVERARVVELRLDVALGRVWRWW
jgi:hypothetical protein